MENSVVMEHYVHQVFQLNKLIWYLFTVTLGISIQGAIIYSLVTIVWWNTHTLHTHTIAYLVSASHSCFSMSSCSFCTEFMITLTTSLTSPHPSLSPTPALTNPALINYMYEGEEDTATDSSFSSSSIFVMSKTTSSSSLLSSTTSSFSSLASS